MAPLVIDYTKYANLRSGSSSSLMDPSDLHPKPVVREGAP